MSAEALRIRGPRKGQQRAVPRGTFARNGFGIIQVSHEDWDARISAVNLVREILTSSELPKSCSAFQKSISLVKGMFSRIYVGDCYDWYTTSRMLGHPSADLSKVLSQNLALLKYALRHQNAANFEIVKTNFEREYGLEMLDNYLSMAVDHTHPVEEEGWAYILWSSFERDVLHIGAAGGRIEDVIVRLDREYREQRPYGILAAWLVHDPVEAHRQIHNAFGGHALGDGFFRMDFGQARESMDIMLKESDNFALSPWHDHEVSPVSVIPMERRYAMG